MVRFQKLTRNLFLTLHGHNVHRQQRQLSKFLTRYQQVASHAYCGAAGSVSKMASQQETEHTESCDAILETGPAVRMRSELMVAQEKLGQLPLLTVYVVPV